MRDFSLYISQAAFLLQSVPLSERIFIIGALITVALALVGGVDYFLKEKPHYDEGAAQYTSEPTASSEMAMSTRGTASMQSSAQAVSQSAEGSAARAGPVKKGTPTKKQGETNVSEAVVSAGFSPATTREQSVLAAIVAQNELVNTSVLLQNNDRAALFAWIEGPNVKDVFFALKDSLQRAFSKDVTGLIDETRQMEGGPIVNVLSFTDPSFSTDRAKPEKIIFVRVRTRLYELHVTPGQEGAVSGLIERLSR